MTEPRLLYIGMTKRNKSILERISEHMGVTLQGQPRTGKLRGSRTLHARLQPYRNQKKWILLQHGHVEKARRLDGKLVHAYELYLEHRERPLDYKPDVLTFE